MNKRIKQLEQSVKELSEIDRKRANEYAEVIIHTAEQTKNFDRAKFLADCGMEN